MSKQNSLELYLSKNSSKCFSGKTNNVLMLKCKWNELQGIQLFLISPAN